MHVRTLILVASIALALGAVVVVATPMAAAAQDTTADPAVAIEPTDTIEPATTAATVQQNQIPTNDIIPKPNSGVAPQRRGDRGGSGQLLVFFAMLAAIGVMGLLVWRESKKKLKTRS